jgi:hypothetical protein
VRDQYWRGLWLAATSAAAQSPNAEPHFTLAIISVDETMRLWKPPAFAETDR